MKGIVTPFLIVRLTSLKLTCCARENQCQCRGQIPASDYRILISRAPDRPQAQLYAFKLQQPIPEIAIPLQPTDTDLTIDLQQLLLTIYSQARYVLAIDYQQNPVPPLDLAAQAWLETLG